jgi:hypothetical protein
MNISSPTISSPLSGYYSLVAVIFLQAGENDGKGRFSLQIIIEA